MQPVYTKHSELGATRKDTKKFRYMIVIPSPLSKLRQKIIMFRDVPLSVNDADIVKILHEHTKLKIRSPVISDRIRDHNNRYIDCLNGNRHVYAKAGFLPVLPGVATIGDYKCRIYYATQSITCIRCHEEGHRALDINTCPDLEISLRHEIMAASNVEESAIAL